MPMMTDTDGVVELDLVDLRRDFAALQDKRAAKVKELAPLAAKFRGGNSAGSDSARKRHRAGIAALILAEQFAGKNAPSETALERMANADKRHVDFCDDIERQFADYLILDNEVAALTEGIRHNEELLRVLRADMGMAR